MNDSNSVLLDIDRALDALDEYKAVLPLLSKIGSDGHMELINKILALEKDNDKFRAQNKVFVTALNARQTEAEKCAVALEMEARIEQAENRWHAQYIISVNYEESGPYSIVQIKQKIYEGDLTEDYFICPDGASKWIPVTEALELQDAFSINVEAADTNKVYAEIDCALNTLYEYKKLLSLFSQTGPDGQAGLIDRIQALERENATLHEENKRYVEKLNSRSIFAEKRAAGLEVLLQMEQSKSRNLERKVHYLETKSEKVKEDKAKLDELQKLYDELVDIKQQKANEAYSARQELEKQTADSKKTLTRLEDEKRNLKKTLESKIAKLQSGNKDLLLDLQKERQKQKAVTETLSPVWRQRFGLLSAALVLAVIIGASSYNGLLKKYNEIAYDPNELLADNESLKKQLGDTQDQLNDLISANEQLKEKQASIETQLSSMQSRLETANENLAGTKTQLVSVSEQLASANSQTKYFINKYLVTITNIYVGNYGSNGWITQPGNILRASDMRFLKPRVFIQSPLTGKQNIEFFVKIFDPNGNIWGLSNAPAGFSYTETALISSSSTMIEFKGLGNEIRSLCGAGTWRIEIWLGGVCIGTTTVKIQ